MKSYLTCHSRPHSELYFLRLSGGAIEYRANSECYTVQDASGLTVAWLYCRDETQRYSGGAGNLTSEEARRIGKGMSRIPEFIMQLQDFTRGGGPRRRGSSPPALATLAALLSRALPDTQRSAITTDRVHDLLEKE
ncbi:hypothetical protein KIP88_20680 [Bradyrhizobium sp. SRL28]|uniref:hypothetical protein n=1 Tax=Bradyrhizobium sp. SRL28 TaxID=2836178 RepID=UPI001BDE3055|nr:hypothetical protein [Bradyrhizobium sp. SRL28]MBT1512911.1 hypothetical protein [Bradyrhizobium sp. SRL28]